MYKTDEYEVKSGLSVDPKLFEKSVRIKNLQVFPKYERQGIGTGLLAQALNRMKSKGIKNVFLHIVSKNEAVAKKIYEKAEFKYVEGEDKKYMHKKL